MSVNKLGLSFDACAGAVELTVTCLNEIIEEQFTEEYRLINVDMESKRVWYSLFDDWNKAQLFIDTKVRSNVHTYSYLVLPSTLQIDVIKWTENCYRHFFATQAIKK